ncbi:MAG TPA: hypothetical protein ENH24_03455 [Nitrospirae bacterium]|nr:hypothetical protein [Nitrospirota bacterium]
MQNRKRPKKHPCPDCNFCQWCNDSKCGMCRPSGKNPGKKKKPCTPVLRKFGVAVRFVQNSYG